MNVKEIDCTRAEEQDLGARYLAGTLSEPEAQEFEAHFLTCARCLDEIRQAGELREAFGHPYAVLGRTGADRKASRDLWTPLAAAAVVAVLAVGLGRLASGPGLEPESPVLRGADMDVLELTVTPGQDGEVVLEWQPHPEASTYRVAVLRSDGLPVLKSETPDSRIELSLGALPPPPPGVSLLAKVEALDPMGQVVARSELMHLP